MLSVAIVGSGPAGCYAAEALSKRADHGVSVDLIDRLPTPFGLVRAGVAPDHQSIKAVARRFEAAAAASGVRLLGGIEVGRDIGVDELCALYHAVVLATGAPVDRRLGVPGEDLPGVLGSAAFVGWYNGHPDHAAVTPPVAGSSAAIIGNGNVALDCARILAKRPAEFAGSDLVLSAERALAHSRLREIHVIGRRGPEDARFSAKELAEMGELAGARPIVDPADLPADAPAEPARTKLMAILRGFSQPGGDDRRPLSVRFHFHARPLAFSGDRALAGLLLETRDGERTLPCQLAITCIGYHTEPLSGVPFDADAGHYRSERGCIAPGLYCVGWARRGPSGTIGTNRPDADEVVARIVSEAVPVERHGAAGLDRLLAMRGVVPATLATWRCIDDAERARARAGRVREKFATHDELAAAARLPAGPAASMSARSVGE